MVRLKQFVSLVRSIARDRADKRRFKGWHRARHKRRG